MAAPLRQYKMKLANYFSIVRGRRAQDVNCVSVVIIEMEELQ